MAVNITFQKLGPLKKRSEFLHVRNGRYKAQGGLVVQSRKTPEDTIINGGAGIRVGFTATKKIGNAVVRNRAKRRMREVARAVLGRHGRCGYDYVFIARNSTAHRAFDKLLSDGEKAVLSLSSNPDTHAQSNPR